MCPKNFKKTHIIIGSWIFLSNFAPDFTILPASAGANF